MGILDRLFNRGGQHENVFNRFGIKREDVGEIRIMGQSVVEIEDRFSITGRGVVVFGKLLMDIKPDQPVELILSSGESLDTGDLDVRIKGIEKNREMLPSAAAGDHVGVLLG